MHVLKHCEEECVDCQSPSCLVAAVDQTHVPVDDLVIKPAAWPQALERAAHERVAEGVVVDDDLVGFFVGAEAFLDEVHVALVYLKSSLAQSEVIGIILSCEDRLVSIARAPDHFLSQPKGGPLRQEFKDPFLAHGRGLQVLEGECSPRQVSCAQKLTLPTLSYFERRLLAMSRSHLEFRLLFLRGGGEHLDLLERPLLTTGLVLLLLAQY